MLRTLFFALVAVAIFSPSVLADQITLKNGDRLTGAIVKSDGKSLTIKSEYAGEVTVPWEAIEQISSNQLLYLTLKDSQMIVGTVATSAGKLEVRTSDAGTVALAKDAIQSAALEGRASGLSSRAGSAPQPGVAGFMQRLSRRRSELDS